MATAPKKTKKKRQSASKRLPLKRSAKNQTTTLKSKKKPAAKKRQKTYNLWFGSSRRLIITIKPAKKSTKKQRLFRQKRRTYTTFAVITASCLGIAYFSYLLVAPVPQPPALAAPLQETQSIETPTPELATYTRSTPLSLQIPSIQLDAELIGIGLNTDKTLEVPSVYDKAGWYTLGVTPGEQGPAIIVGHVNSKTAPAIFWNLSKILPGSEIFVVREDGTRVMFQVSETKQYSQNNFPTNEVYGNVDYAALRLITCGGTYNKLTRRYSHNTVVFARMVQ